MYRYSRFDVNVWNMFPTKLRNESSHLTTVIRMDILRELGMSLMMLWFWVLISF
jgi:hypothetical protein